MNKTSDPVVVVGAGMAGLRAAVELQKHTENVLVLEASECAGGRVQTDRRDGFLLDRGFQIFLTAYPESRSVFDYDDLTLYPFMDGALIHQDETFHELVDPVSHPGYVFSAMRSEIGTWEDRWLTWKLLRRLRNESIDELLTGTSRTTRQFLENEGFSQSYIDGFLRPFFSGVFLESDLRTAHSLFQFLFRMFGDGKGTLPANGMQSVPEQLVHRLNGADVQYETEVTRVSSDGVSVEGGKSIEARAVIVAVDGWSATSLDLPGESDSNGTTCFYFSAYDSPVERPILVLNGEVGGCVTNLCVPSVVCPNYSPPDRHLISVSTVHDSDSRATVEDVEQELNSWFGDQVNEWELLETYEIPNALPQRYPEDGALEPVSPRLDNGLYLAGDYRDTPSLNGALASGRRAGEAVVEDLGLS